MSDLRVGIGLVEDSVELSFALGGDGFVLQQLLDLRLQKLVRSIELRLYHQNRTAHCQFSSLHRGDGGQGRRTGPVGRRGAGPAHRP